MTPSLLPCPRCGAKNDVAAARCYSCAAALDTNEQAAASDIPDTLLDNAARALQEEPAPPRDTTDRMGIALAGTLGVLFFGFILVPIVLLFTGGWILLLPALYAPEIGFYCYIGIMFVVIAALWLWALKKE